MVHFMRLNPAEFLYRQQSLNRDGSAVLCCAHHRKSRQTPSRAASTRSSQNFLSPFGAPSLSAGSLRSFPVLSSTQCSIPSGAQAYSLNVTVLPPGPLGYLILWPEGQDQPNTVTVDDITGDIRNNAVIMPAGISGGGVSAVVNATTDLVIDINGYYAPLDAGPTHAYFSNNANDVTIRLGSPSQLVTLSVPAGSYVIDATTHLFGFEGQAQGDLAKCQLTYNGSLGAFTFINSGSYLTALVQDTVTLIFPTTIDFPVLLTAVQEAIQTRLFIPRCVPC